MKRLVLRGLVIIASAVIVVSFFKPWARVSVSVMGVSKELTSIAKEKLGNTPVAGKIVGKLQKITSAISDFGDIDVKTTVTGYSIPSMVNNKTSKVALSVVQIMFKSTEGLDVKSYLVYLLPVFGIVCGVLALFGSGKKIYVVLMLMISGIISIAGLYNLRTADVTTLAVKVTVGQGLWNTMYAFLFIFLISVAWLALDRK